MCVQVIHFSCGALHHKLDKAHVTLVLNQAKLHLHKVCVRTLDVVPLQLAGMQIYLSAQNFLRHSVCTKASAYMAATSTP